jgi:glycosyltransferase involved in cell wall biosynthesis
MEWVERAAWDLPWLPLRTEGEPAEARFVVCASTRPESWPAGVAEAMAAGRPVIAPWQGAAPELVLEGVTGFLCAAGDVASLRSQMEYLWDHPEQALRMGEEARKQAKEHLGPDAHARTIVRWYLRAGVSRLAV